MGEMGTGDNAQHSAGEDVEALQFFLELRNFASFYPAHTGAQARMIRTGHRREAR